MDNTSRSIVIGGPIAAGKSSVVGALPFEGVQELKENDAFQVELLKRMYESNDVIAKRVFQIDMLLTRADEYLEKALSGNTYVFDRGIWEDILFCEIQHKDSPDFVAFYKELWDVRAKEIVMKAKPNIYIHLSIDWETFKKRIFKRNRLAEVNNFEKNEAYFKDLLDKYDDYVINKVKELGIDYEVLAVSNLTQIEQIDAVKDILRKRGYDV